jgi:ABC-type phosphate transport system substrate-binding protein
MGGMQLRRRLLVVAVALAAVVVVATARAASVISETTWGGPGSEVTNGAAVASDGSSYLTGFTNSFVQSGQQAFLTKFAADGSLSWQRTFQGQSSSRPTRGRALQWLRTAPST